MLKFKHYLVLVWVAATACTTANGLDAINIEHDGIQRSSTKDSSLVGIGKSKIAFGDSILTVDGQFRLVRSAKLILIPAATGTDQKFRAEPTSISLVALGQISLRLQGAKRGTYRARKAVYLFKEDRWLLDGKSLN